MPPTPKTVDEYLAPLRPEQRAALESLRRIIRAAAPQAEECIAYRMPAFRLNGVMLVSFAAAAQAWWRPTLAAARPGAVVLVARDAGGDDCGGGIGSDFSGPFASALDDDNVTSDGYDVFDLGLEMASLDNVWCLAAAEGYCTQYDEFIPTASTASDFGAGHSFWFRGPNHLEQTSQLSSALAGILMSYYTVSHR
ncbi:MAG TPA: DUF1801 domain-containing protein [Gemmatimonadaceae bacterium]|nr:DUF1801 domain-containing protein [Gemmatimonadaceae bacterium]